MRRKEWPSMKQAKWAKLLVVVLVCAGGALVWGHRAVSQAPAPATPVPGTLSVPELGKDRTATVLRSWHHADGKTFYEIRDPDTGERLIVIDQDPGVPGAAEGSGRRIIRWGGRNVTPIPANV